MRRGTFLKQRHSVPPLRKPALCICGVGKQRRWHLVCPDCWAKIPRRLRAELWSAYKEDPGSERHRRSICDCIEFLKKGANHAG